MNLKLFRFSSLPDSTLGLLSVDGRFQCFTLEDQYQVSKIPDETRIPSGIYQIKLRTEGPLNEKYRGKFTEHRGMLWLQDVPGFEFIYIHVGNTDDHTSGCILVGDSAHVEGALDRSTQAYRRVYGIVSNAILAGDPVSIEVT